MEVDRPAAENEIRKILNDSIQNNSQCPACIFWQENNVITKTYYELAVDVISFSNDIHEEKGYRRIGIIGSNSYLYVIAVLSAFAGCSTIFLFDKDSDIDTL